MTPPDPVLVLAYWLLLALVLWGDARRRQEARAKHQYRTNPPGPAPDPENEPSLYSIVTGVSLLEAIHRSYTYRKEPK